MTTTPDPALHRHRTDRGDAPTDATPTRTQPTDTAPTHTGPTHTAPTHTGPIHTGPIHTGPTAAVESDHRTVLATQRSRFGGIKWGSAFFGWLATVGTAVLMMILLAAIAGALGYTMGGTDPTRMVDEAGRAVQDPAAMTPTPGVVAALLTAVVVFVAYYCGGYVAGRMARFDGAKQGVAVWLWSILFYVAAALLGVIAARTAPTPTTQLVLPDAIANGMVPALISGVIGLVLALLGAVSGGLGGMRFHRRVDRT
jgi:hypothetical protein